MEADDDNSEFDALLKSNMTAGTNNTRRSTIQDNDSARASGDLDQALEDEHDAAMTQRLLKRNNTIDRRRSSRRQTMALKNFNKNDPIQLRAMTKEFGDFRAVDGLTLSIK